MGYVDHVLTAKVATAMDGQALEHLRETFETTGEAAVASFDRAAHAAVYNDTVERVLARGEELADELDGNLRQRVLEIADRLRRRRDTALAKLAAQ